MRCFSSYIQVREACRNLVQDWKAFACSFVDCTEAMAMGVTRQSKPIEKEEPPKKEKEKASIWRHLVGCVTETEALRREAEERGKGEARQDGREHRGAQPGQLYIIYISYLHIYTYSIYEFL